MVTAPEKLNFLYRFEAGSNVYRFTNIAENQVYNSEAYDLIQIEHTAPTFSGDPEDGEIEVTMKESNAIADLFVLGPPPYPIILRIYEYNRETDTIDDNYYKGWVVRSGFKLETSEVSLRFKMAWHFFERQSFTDSLSILSRYSIYDPRSGVNINNYRVNVAVTALNSYRDELTVTGITQPDDWFTGGMIVAPDGDKRTILKHTTVSGDKILTLNAAFPSFTLDVGFSADIFPGDDLIYDTWANKFGADTNNGEAWGGWQYTPNVDPAVRGVI